MHSTPPTLSTKRLRLGPSSAADGGVLEPVLNEPVVREMFHWPPEQHTSGDQWVARQLQAQELDPAAVFTVRTYGDTTPP